MTRASAILEAAGEAPPPKASGTVHNQTIDLGKSGLKPAGRAPGTLEGVLRVGWRSAINSGQSQTVAPTAYGWKILRDKESLPHGHPHGIITPDGQAHLYKQKIG